MRAAILGCGAMGTVLGAFLSRGGFPVDMIDSYAEHVRALNENGARVVGTEEFTAPVRALLPEEMQGIYDVVFLMTKQTANAAALSALLPHLGPRSAVCTLQNGMPELDVARYIGKERTLGGTLLWGATFVGPGVTRLTTSLEPKRLAGKAFFDIGETDGSLTPRLREIAGILEHMGKTDQVTDLMDARWCKLIINCAGSGMSAACGCTFGEVIDDPRALECLGNLAYEASLVGLRSGYDIVPSSSAEYLRITLDPKRYQKFYYGLHAKDRAGKASMLQDLERGRLTEVDMLNGVACELGRRTGTPTPYNDAVVSVVHRMERGELPFSMSNLQYFPDIHYDAYELGEKS